MPNHDSLTIGNLKRLRHLVYAVVLIMFDQITKYFARNAFSDGSDFVIIPDVFRFVFHKNEGAVWGFLSETKNSVLILTIASLIILAIILFVYFRIPDIPKYHSLLILVVFITAGAVGNLIDRFFLNYVTDFIYIELINFPVFNIADSYITVSVFLLIFLTLFKYKDDDFAFLSLKKNK